MVKKYKKDSNVSYTLGATVTMELLNKCPSMAKAVYLSSKADMPQVVKRANELNLPTIVGDKAFNILSSKENCFVIGEFEKINSKAYNDNNHVVLVNPSNSGNLGTIIRAIAGFDCADLIIITPSVDPFDPKTVRASMGALFDINFECFDSFEKYLNKYGENRVIMPFMLDGVPFGEKSFDKSTKYSLVFGNEARGLPNEFAKYDAVRIEQSNKVDSLNLSIAVAIALYKLKIR